MRVYNEKNKRNAIHKEKRLKSEKIHLFNKDFNQVLLDSNMHFKKKKKNYV